MQTKFIIMKKILHILAIVFTTAILFNACTKVETLPNYANGNAITLTASKAAVTPTLADTTKDVVAFSWTSPKYATDTNNYKFILEIDSTTRNFSKGSTKIIIGKLGATYTGRELNAILLNYGFSLGVAYNMDVRVISSYGNNNERYTSNVIKLSVTPYNDPAVLTTAFTSVTTSLANASLPSNSFSWAKAFIGYNGTITYTLQYDSTTKNFANVKEIPVGSSILTKALNQGEMNETALNSGVPGGNSGKVDYRVKAITSQGAISYSNTVSVTIQSYFPIIRLYMPGGYQSALGQGSDWTPSNAPELIRDQRSGANNSIYYTYAYLRANDEFKITEGRDWAIAYGAASSPSGASGNFGGQNFKVTANGVYRISINRTTQTYDIRLGRMGFVGGAIPGNGWSPSTTYTDANSQMGLVRRDQFIGVNDFNTGGWKMIDNNSWNNGNVDITNNRSYGSSGGDGSPMEVNGANMPDVATAKRYRVIWDGTDPNSIKYFMNSATEMRVVGDGINQAGVNDWDPGSSPQMTYLGNGQWQISITLKANKSIKFLAGNGWGAFDYEDDGAGVGAGVRKLKWNGGNNFNTPTTAGTYTITLDEKAGTVTIN